MIAINGIGPRQNIIDPDGAALAVAVIIIGIQFKLTAYLFNDPVQH
jgi:hypothetical protein